MSDPIYHNPIVQRINLRSRRKSFRDRLIPMAIVLGLIALYGILGLNWPL